LASVDQPFSTEQDPNSGNGTTANSSVGQAPQLSSGQGGTTTGQGAGTAGNSNAPAGNSNTSVTAGGVNGQGATTGTNSGNYPNLQQYMTANQNWNSAQGGLGGEVASNLNSQGQQVNQSAQIAQNAFQNQGNTWQQNTANAENTFSQGLSNPYGFTQNNPNAMSTANQALNAQYTGAQNLFGNNPNLQQQEQNYTSTAGQTGSESGRYALLQNMFGGNNYTQGEQGLDQALIQTSPQQMQQLQGAAQQANRTNQNLQNLNAQDVQQAQGWTQYGQQAQQAAAQGLNSAIGNLGSTLQGQYQAAEQSAPQQLAAAQAAINSGNISAQQAQDLGITNGEYFYNVNPGQYATQANITQQDTATQQQYQQMQALAQLGGLNASAVNPASSGYLNTYNTANMPTQFLTPGNYVDYHKADLQSAIANAASTYQNQANPLAQTVEQNAGAFASNVTPAGINSGGAFQIDPFTGGGMWMAPAGGTGVSLNTNTLTATGSPVETLFGPTNYGTSAQNLLNLGEQRVLANGPAGTQVANNLGEGQTQGYAGNYNSTQSLAYLNALSSLMGLNQQMGAGNEFNIIPSS
jgi:hypothetical protein